MQNDSGKYGSLLCTKIVIEMFVSIAIPGGRKYEAYFIYPLA